MKGRIMGGRHSTSTGAGGSASRVAPSRGAAFAVGAGACLALWGGWRPGWAGLAALAVLALAAFRLARRLPWRLPAASALPWLLAGFLATAAVVERQVERRWPAALDGQRVLVEGQVAGLPQADGSGRSFELAGRVVAPSTLARPLRLRIRSHDAAVMPLAGERWRLLLRLAPPLAALNPGGPDGERALFAARIDALASVVHSQLAQRLPPDASWRPGPSLDALRERIATRIRERVVDRDAAALVAGLAVGATADLSLEQWRVFGATGTVHLVAISGLHVTLFATLATLAARRAWRVLRLGRRIDREPFAGLCGLAAALGYALLAGFGVPAQRTLLMLAAWWLARLCGRRVGALDALGLALLPVLALDPLAPLGAGFWLSFASIGVLMGTDALDRAALPGVAPVASRRALSMLRELLVTQLRVTVALAPATLLLFGNVPFAGLVANLLAIPLFSVVLVPLVLGGLALLPWSATLAALAWEWVERCYLATWPLFEAMADWPAGQWRAAPDATALPATLLALPLLAFPLPWSLRCTALVALAPLLWPPAQPLPPAQFRALLLETGDGTALLVATRRHALLYDTGDVYGSEGARAATVVSPALQALGFTRLDLVVQSRANGFRVAGVANLLQRHEVGELVSGGAWAAGPRPHLACDRHAGWLWDGVEIRAFPAGDTLSGDPPSCVLRVAADFGRGATLLVPGQVDADEALRLASTATASSLRADIVLAPRRGALAAANPAFVAAVGASQVLVASRALPPEKRAAIARRWHVDPGKVHGTANQGAIWVEPGAGDPIDEVRPWAAAEAWRPWRVPREQASGALRGYRP